MRPRRVATTERRARGASLVRGLSAGTLASCDASLHPSGNVSGGRSELGNVSSHTASVARTATTGSPREGDLGGGAAGRLESGQNAK